ncbi:2-oxoacid:acceptor oxidoreductase subunit alpha [Patescibacteria group bacterium]|nr:2-oxoacid:acceptor oxidoreductase subunit alpha [Patescibacteria group bacterium]MCL5797282.1 2-oxoacid:acceptor oxidoreductase subunit alpha [Patescibacteria group bacterium]
MINLTVKIGGEAGFGIMTTGLFLGKIATRSGYHAFEYTEYPSLIRGSHNVVGVRISDEKTYSQEEKVDVLLCLNADTYKRHISEMKQGGMVVYDRDKTDINSIKDENRADLVYVHVPFAKILQEGAFPTVMLNNIAMGALMYLIGADFGILKNLISENFIKKGEEVINKNVNASQMGYDKARESDTEGYKVKIPKKESISSRMYLSGNEAVGLGTLAAGCKFYVAYPMTPASALLHYLAAKAEKSGMVVKHAEDEISVINMALGASWAGVRSMVGTSGGGFALMVESVSLAGITETPIVIAMVQRPGPATGMPTWTEQGDLLFIVHAGHGEFPKIVLSPGDVGEAYQLTTEAFNLADKYQTPVFILSDKYLQEGKQSIDRKEIEEYKFDINRGKLLTAEKLEVLPKGGYKRYLLTEDGISPRAIPGLPNSLQQANSYEHIEDGHTTEDAQERIKQVDKRNRKIRTYLSADFKMPQLFGPKDAELTIVSWGSMKGPVLQAMQDCGNKFNYLHFTHLWPLDKEKVSQVLKSLRKTLLVENNSTAQLGQLLQMVTGVELDNKLLKYSGRPVFPEEILARIKELGIG